MDTTLVHTRTEIKSYIFGDILASLEQVHDEACPHAQHDGELVFCAQLLLLLCLTDRLVLHTYTNITNKEYIIR